MLPQHWCLLQLSGPSHDPHVVSQPPQGYWQSAIAARPSAAHTGYLLGGIMWFCIPFTLATTMGLSALALDLPISLAESGQGALLMFLGFSRGFRV